MAKSTKKRPRYERFTEIAQVKLGGRLDHDTKIVHDVAILGPRSQNGRTYTPQALQDAVKVFEGKRVFLNHRETNGRQTKPHSAADYIGRLSGLHLGADGKVHAREFRVVNEQHWPLISAGEKDPEAFGLSIDGEGEIRKGVVHSIRKGHSVDLVSEPATNKGLFEQQESDEVNDMDWDKVTREEIEKNAGDQLGEIREEIDAEHKKALETLTKERDELTKLSEGLKKLVDGKSDEKDEAEKELQEQVQTLRDDLAKQKQSTDVQEALRAKGISDCPEALERALYRCQKPEEMATLLECYPIGDHRPRSGLKGGKADPKAEDASLQEAFTTRETGFDL